jgi:hypothetical protein
MDLTSTKAQGVDEKQIRNQSPRSREAGNISCTTLLQGLTKILTERAMKNHRKTMQELTADTPKESKERDACRPSYEVHGGITFIPQKPTRLRRTRQA